MKIGISSTGRSLVENVYKRFWRSPVYMIYDTKKRNFEYITNYCKYGESIGPQVAQILVNKKVKIVITDEIDEVSYNIFKNSSIKVYSGYPGLGKEALANFSKGNLKPVIENSINIKKIEKDLKIKKGFRSKINHFIFLDKALILKGKNRLFEDWEMKLHLDAKKRVPKNWSNPVNYANGIYHLQLEVIEMKKIEKLIEFEFGWCNYIEEKHPNIPHRCTFGYYSNFTSPGVYEHMARIKDMENTSVDGKEENWNWKAGWDSPFCLIKPYGQDPFPVKLRVTVTVYEA